MYKYISLKVAAFVTKGSIILGQLCQNRKEKSNVEKNQVGLLAKVLAIVYVSCAYRNKERYALLFGGNFTDKPFSEFSRMSSVYLIG